MNDSNIYQKVFNIHDQVMGIIRSMKIPPYPAHYKKFFDKLFLEMADAELRKDQQDSEQKILSSPKDDVTRYVDIAKRSVMSFTESHAEITSVAQEQQEYINNDASNTLEEYIGFTQGLSILNKNLSEELDKAQLKINDLTIDLQEALSVLTIDPLTKVGNRNGFMDDLESIIEAGQSKKISMVLMMIDVDNFKYINEEHGHLAGDKILYFIAQTIKAMIRTSDKIYRYGGEEFAVVMSRCDEMQAYTMADNIRSKIEQSNLVYLGKSVYVTISVGVTVHQKGDTFDSIVGRVDKALFCAKKSNKNCTVLLDC
jgi:diguanylate cyclase